MNTRLSLWASPKLFLCLPALLPALLFFAPEARAHRVYLFAWEEGAQVCSESYFSKNAKIQDAPVEVLDAEGKILASGRTDAKGLFCFPRPGDAALSIVVDAGQGHRGEYSLPAKSSASLPVAPSSPPHVAAPVVEMPANDALRAIVREELERSLPPLIGHSLNKYAVQQREREPGPREIVGGLGWLAGLAGLALWWRSRRAP